MTYHAQLDDELVNQFLCVSLVNIAIVKVVLNIDIEEWGYIAQWHGCTILFFYGSQISHIYPLNGFLCICCGATQIQSVIFSHYFDFLQGFDLFCHFFAQTDTGIGHRTADVMQVFLLGFNQAVNAIKSQTAIITDDTSAGIVVRQSGQKTKWTERTDFFGIRIKYAIVVGLAVMIEDIFHFFIHFHTVFTAGLFHYFDTTERFDGTA